MLSLFLFRLLPALFLLKIQKNCNLSMKTGFQALPERGLVLLHPLVRKEERLPYSTFFVRVFASVLIMLLLERFVAKRLLSLSKGQALAILLLQRCMQSLLSPWSGA